MANLFSSGAPHIHILLQFCNDWSAYGDGSALTSKAISKSNFLSDDTYRWNYVIILQTNRARWALNKKYSARKVFLEKAVVELVYKFDEKSCCECLKGESIAEVQFNFFWSSNIMYIPSKYIQGHQHRSLYPACAACVR